MLTILDTIEKIKTNKQGSAFGAGPGSKSA